MSLLLLMSRHVTATLHSLHTTPLHFTPLTAQQSAGDLCTLSSPRRPRSASPRATNSPTLRPHLLCCYCHCHTRPSHSTCSHSTPLSHWVVRSTASSNSNPLPPRDARCKAVPLCERPTERCHPHQCDLCRCPALRCPPRPSLACPLSAAAAAFPFPSLLPSSLPVRRSSAGTALSG